MRQEVKHSYGASDSIMEVVSTQSETWIDGILASYEKGLKVPVS
jgi:hypothetical protein